MRVASPIGFALAVFLLLACGSINQAELDCEEAVSVLNQCCPGFDSTQLACIRDSDCLGNGNIPALSQGESQCIRDESCGALVANGVCARAQQARSCRRMSDFEGTYYGPCPSHPDVCP